MDDIDVIKNRMDEIKGELNAGEEDLLQLKSKLAQQTSARLSLIEEYVKLSEKLEEVKKLNADNNTQ